MIVINVNTMNRTFQKFITLLERVDNAPYPNVMSLIKLNNLLNQLYSRYQQISIYIIFTMLKDYYSKCSTHQRAESKKLIINGLNYFSQVKCLKKLVLGYTISLPSPIASLPEWLRGVT